MNRKQLKKLIKLENSDEFKEIMFTHKLNIHYYSDTIIEYIKEYLEIIEEDFNDMDNLKKIFIPKLEYEINKYKKKYKEYQNTITQAGIENFKHKGLLLEVIFMDGSTYEYFGVTKPIYNKLVNADNTLRFAKRNIFNSYQYRKVKSAIETA